MEKEVESSTTLAGETLAEPEQTLLGNTKKKGKGALSTRATRLEGTTHYSPTEGLSYFNC